MSPTSFPQANKEHFFIVGAQRSGTTYLYELLESHPDVAMAKPVKPEPKWFLDPQKVTKGAAVWEQTLFPGTQARVLGEKGTSYIEYPLVADSILSYFPQARFVVIVREPIARAVSNYRFSVGNGLEKLPLEQALTLEAEKRPFDTAKISVSPYSYLHRGIYADYLEAWMNRVPQEKVHLVVLEELVRDKSLEGLCAFLGIAPYHPQNMDKLVNAATEPMPDIPERLRKDLARYFEGPNHRLEKLLGRPLDLWRK